MDELSKIGKFDSPESLLKAYEALCKEFTKRCQKLKENEKEIAGLKEAAADTTRLVEYAKQALSDESFIDTEVVGRENIKEKVIAEYLVSLHKGVTPVLGSSAGTSVLAPPNRPGSLSEAKRLADIILNG